MNNNYFAKNMDLNRNVVAQSAGQWSACTPHVTRVLNWPWADGKVFWTMLTYSKWFRLDRKWFDTLGIFFGQVNSFNSCLFRSERSWWHLLVTRGLLLSPQWWQQRCFRKWNMNQIILHSSETMGVKPILVNTRYKACHIFPHRFVQLKVGLTFSQPTLWAIFFPLAEEPTGVSCWQWGCYFLQSDLLGLESHQTFAACSGDRHKLDSSRHTAVINMQVFQNLPNTT